MSKKLFKIITLILASVACFSMLIACGGNEEGEKACEHSFEKYVCINCGRDYYDVNLAYIENELGNGYKVVGVGDATDIENIRIPATHDGKPVTAIGERAFYNQKEIKSVFIADGVKIIGANAFEKCSNMTNINLPSSITKVGEDAFLGCIRLEYNKLGPVYYLGNEENLFHYLDKVTNVALTNVEIDIRCRVINHATFDRLENLEYAEKDGFLYLGTTWNKFMYLAKCSNTNLSTVKIDFNCSIINPSALTACANRKIVSVAVGNGYFKQDGNCIIDTETNTILLACEDSVIPEYVIGIGDYAFSNLKGITEFSVPQNIKSIGEGAFFGCSNLENVNIPTSVLEMGANVFMGCDDVVVECAIEKLPHGWNSGWLGRDN